MFRFDDETWADLDEARTLIVDVLALPPSGRAFGFGFRVGAIAAAMKFAGGSALDRRQLASMITDSFERLPELASLLAGLRRAQ